MQVKPVQVSTVCTFTDICFKASMISLKKKKYYPNSFKSNCTFFMEYVVYLLSIEITSVLYIYMFGGVPMFLQPYQAGRYNTYPLQTAEIL